MGRCEIGATAAPPPGSCDIMRMPSPSLLGVFVCLTVLSTYTHTHTHYQSSSFGEWSFFLFAFNLDRHAVHILFSCHGTSQPSDRQNAPGHSFRGLSFNNKYCHDLSSHRSGYLLWPWTSWDLNAHRDLTVDGSDEDKGSMAGIAENFIIRVDSLVAGFYSMQCSVFATVINLSLETLSSFTSE